jgi:ABC-type uncharacterized transport system involved in gliding motility auxiliary subunit
VPASGTADTTDFTISQPSSIAWNWETQYLLVPLLTIVVVPVVLAVLLVFLLLRRRKSRGLLAPASGSV